MPEESNHYLLTLAHEHGYAITATQLARWHRAGLLPRPKQQAQGKGRGSQSYYPVGTGTQLLLLCELHRNERRLSYLAWQLWWSGYPVDLAPIQAHLHAASTRLTQQVRYFTELRGSELADEAAQEDVLDRIERFAVAHLHYKLLRRARKRLGTDQFPTFVRMLVEIASGTFNGNDRHEAIYDAREEMTELRILAKGMGLEEAFVRDDANISHYMGTIIAPLLQQFSAWLPTLPWERALQRISTFALLQARDQVRLTLTNLPRALPIQRELLRDYPTWSTGLQDTLQELDVEGQAMLLVLWIALLDEPHTEIPQL